MITLEDFNTICRLCLSKDDERLVDLFSMTEYLGPTDEKNAMLISDVVKSFCKIEVFKGDGLPEHICNKCLNSLLSLHKLQIESHKSNRLLYEIMNAHKCSQNNNSPMIKQLIEFIDTETNLKMEILSGSESQNSHLMEPNWNGETPSKADKIKVKKKVSGTNRKVSCEMCGKMVPYNFIEFHLNLHKNIRPYKCEVENCGKYFIAPTHAKTHYRKVHINGIIKPHKCDVCGRGFNQKSALSMHKTYHFDPQIPCQICGQFYRNKRAITKHLLVHSGERAYTCIECKKSFQTKSTLRVHMRTHTLEKPYSCSECTKTFAYKCLLKAHSKKHHPK